MHYILSTATIFISSFISKRILHFSKCALGRLWGHHPVCHFHQHLPDQRSRPLLNAHGRRLFLPRDLLAKEKVLGRGIGQRLRPKVPTKLIGWSGTHLSGHESLWILAPCDFALAAPKIGPIPRCGRCFHLKHFHIYEGKWETCGEVICWNQQRTLRKDAPALMPCTEHFWAWWSHGSPMRLTHFTFKKKRYPYVPCYKYGINGL